MEKLVANIFAIMSVSNYYYFSLNPIDISPESYFSQFSSVTQSCPTLCDRMHARAPCSSLTPRVYSNSYPLSRWCYSTISSSVVPFSCCLQCFPLSGSFLMSQFFISGGQSISPSNEYSGLISFRMNWLDLFSVQGTLKSSPTPQFKSINSLVLIFLYRPTHIHTWLLEKP